MIKPIRDELHAFVPGDRVVRNGSPGGPLDGLTFAAKDNFDIAGEVAGAGHPAWPLGRAPAQRHAAAVERLLVAGARLVGKTVMDPLAFGAVGRNEHFATPMNPAAPNRRPGGSSSGSASAVAGGAVDFALGTDSACSVRLPASMCGIFGMRPSFGRVPVAGTVALSPTLDTVGWLARDAVLMQRVGEVLLDRAERTQPIDRLAVPGDAWALAEASVVEALTPQIDRLAGLVGAPEAISISESEGPLALQSFRMTSALLQVQEVWQQHGEWIERAQPDSEVLTRESLIFGANATDEDRAALRRQWHALTTHIESRVPPGTVLCLPTASGVAPPLDVDDTRPFVGPTLTLLSIAVLAGLPQLSLPGVTVGGLPVGLSLVGARGSDELLLELAVALASP